MTTVNDIVLIYFEGEPLTFARVESIEPDVKRDWYHVQLLMLQLPLQVVTWILRDVYIDGEPFTMEGKQIRLEKVESPVAPSPADEAQEEEAAQVTNTDKAAKGNVISLSDLKKK